MNPTKRIEVGLREVDAKEPLDFYISETDVFDGRRLDPENCTIACALRRVAGVQHVYVRPSVTIITLIDPESETGLGILQVRYRTPKVLRDGLNSYDTIGDWSLKPGRYTLPTLRAAKKNNGKKKHHRYPKRRKEPRRNGTNAMILSPRGVAIREAKAGAR